MKYSKEIRKITDQLSYNLLYAPDYPEEDRTSLEKEELRIREWLADVLQLIRREDVGDWLRLGSSAVATAFEKFRAEQDREARKDIDAAIQYLKNALVQKQHKPDFISSPDGTIVLPPNE